MQRGLLFAEFQLLEREPNKAGVSGGDERSLPEPSGLPDAVNLPA
jgi:hypothetical protein